VRPTALVPIWNIAGFLLGAGLWIKTRYPPNKLHYTLQETYQALIMCEYAFSVYGPY
jgi:hypothetical protein